MLDERTASVKAAATGLRIAELRVHSVAIADPPLRSSYGLHAPYALRTIIELDGGDGIIGLGETHGGEAIARVLESLKPKLAGSDPFRLLGEIAFSAYAFYKHAGGGGENGDQRDDFYGEALTPEAIVKQVQQMTREYGF